MIQLNSEVRYRRIMGELKRREVVPVSDLCWLLSVSARTVRRDLAEMEEKGIVRRVRGGAMLATLTGPGEDLPLENREVSFREEKLRIGNAAAQLVRRGDCVLLDSGTTTLEVARHLPRGYDLTVVTNALTIAAELASRTDVSLVLTGGSYYKPGGSFVGPLTEHNLQTINADIGFIACAGVDLEKGLTNTNLFEFTKRTMMEVSRRVVLVADHSKFGQAKLAIFGTLDEVDMIITDSGIDEDTLRKFREAGVRIEVA